MKPRALVLMGVSGCGKTTVANILAGRLGWPFEEGDALQPEANIENMAAGRPLTDADRWPWLAKVAEGLMSASTQATTDSSLARPSSVRTEI